MDQETKGFLENIMGQINSKFESMETELKNFRQETNKRFDNLETGQKEIKVLIEELDPKNANRHLELKAELKDSINELRKDLTNVEIITSSNWNEIAKLKKIK